MSEGIGTLLSKLARHPQVVVAPARGVPVVELPDALPLDLRRFYEICGGVTLFPASDYPARIVGPQEVVKTNRLLWRGESEATLKELELDRSWHWYSLVSDEKGDFLSIDLSPARLGQCYDSFRDHYAVPGESSVIATSFSDLLRRLVANRGEYWYWLRSGFISMGDAYD